MFANRFLLATTLVAWGTACSWAAEPTAAPDDSLASEFDRRLVGGRLGHDCGPGPSGTRTVGPLLCSAAVEPGEARSPQR